MPGKIAALLLTALLIAKAIGVVLRGPSPIVLDAAGYWELGGLVAGGDWLLMQRPIAYRTPGYPWLIGAIRALFAEPLPVLMTVQAAFWLATIGLTAATAWQLTRRRVVVLATLLGAAPMIASTVYVSAVLTETWFTFLLMAHLWSATRLADRPSRTNGGVAGLTLALTILTRPIALYLWVADAIFLLARWWTSRQEVAADRRRARWSGVITAATVTLVCLAPWLARNRALFGESFLTEFVGRNVWIVTFQGGSGAGLDFPDSPDGERLRRQLGPARWSVLQAERSWRHTWTTARALVASGLDDAAADRLMRQVAWDAISARPMKFARRTIRRWVNFWRTRATELPVQFAELPPGRKRAGEPFAGQAVWGVGVAPIAWAIEHRWSDWLAGNTWLTVVLAVALLRLIGVAETRAAGLWLAAILGYVTTVTALIEIPAYRYRMVIEPVVLLACVLAAVTLIARPESPAAADASA